MYPFDVQNNKPKGFPSIKNEPVFNPNTDLQLEKPKQVTNLEALGYSKKELKNLSTYFAFSSPTRILSHEGVGKLYEVVKLLEPFAKSSERIPRMVRGGVYQSKYLRDLSLSKDITNFFSEITKLKLQPHTIPHQLGHINYNPITKGVNIDKWHTDTLRYDYVLFVTDPNKVKGGEFEYFLGTKQQIEELHLKNLKIPSEKIISIKPPAPGYAIFLHGNMVVHRAKGINSDGERITLVNGYVAKDMIKNPDFTNFEESYLTEPKHVGTSEFVKHTALIVREHLNQFINDKDFSQDRDKYIKELDNASKILIDAIEKIKKVGIKPKSKHFGD
tara:strand:- start:138 stop:1130 length:993 start_codon:yes stop_codon:yes gene_type:complete